MKSDISIRTWIFRGPARETTPRGPALILGLCSVHTTDMPSVVQQCDVSELWITNKIQYSVKLLNVHHCLYTANFKIWYERKWHGMIVLS